MINISKIEMLIKEKGWSNSYFCSLFNKNRGWIRDWKHGKGLPDINTLQAIADKLDTTVEYLTDKAEKKEKPAQNVQVIDENNNIVVLDDETRDLIDSLRSKPEMKMLFSVSKNATKEDIIRAVKIIEALKDQKEGEE